MKLGYSIGITTKMIFMVTFIVFGAVGVVTYIMTSLFRTDALERALSSNAYLAETLADRAHNLLLDSREKMIRMSTLAVTASVASKSKIEIDSEVRKSIQEILQRSDEIVAFSAYRFDDEGRPIHQLTEINAVSAAEFGLKPENFQSLVLAQNIEAHKKRLIEDMIIFNSSASFKAPILSLSFVTQPEVSKPTAATTKSAAPLAIWSNEWVKSRWLFRVDLRKDPLLNLFSQNEKSQAFLIDATGRLLAHSDPSRRDDAMTGSWMTTNRLVDLMVKEKTLESFETPFEDETGERILGAYRKVGFGGLAIVAESKQADALVVIEKAHYRTLLFTIAIFCFAIILNFIFSQSLSATIHSLFEATQNILDGKFEVELDDDSSDEVGALSRAFSSMASNLKKRDNLKGVFNKFHSKETAKKLLSGEIKLGGERRQATVFLSNIRGFSALSEKMSSDQAMLLLNQYMSEMVTIIHKWKGVVDKYMGDTVMAVWGIPEVSANDAYNSVRAALEVREFLIGWNHKRQSMGHVEVAVGMGLSSGELLAGNLGAESRLEYTVIGDAVNQALHIESSAKILETDLLIAHSTYTLVQHLGIVAGPEISLRGKAKGKERQEVSVHQVIGFKDELGNLKTSLTRGDIERIESTKSTTPVETTQVPTLIDSEVRIPVKPMSDPYDRTHVAASHETPRENSWFVVPDSTSRETLGPYTLKELGLKVAQRQIDYNTAFVFENGNDQMIPLAEMLGLNRRTQSQNLVHVDLPETVIRDAATPDEWYVHGHQGETLGPYSLFELEMALSKGNLTRTTYVWKKDLPNWIYLYQIGDFDRRGRQSA